MPLDRPLPKPTEHEVVVLAMYVQRGSVKEAATHLDLAESTVKNTLRNLYLKLDVGSAMEAAVALGWVTLPDRYRICGWQAVCTRLEGHRGHHGGFRGHRQARSAARRTRPHDEADPPPAQR